MRKLLVIGLLLLVSVLFIKNVNSVTNWHIYIREYGKTSLHITSQETPVRLNDNTIMIRPSNFEWKPIYVIGATVYYSPEEIEFNK